MGALSGEQPRAAGAAAAEANAGIKPLAPGLRILLLVASGLVLIAGVQLFVLTEYTDSYFAWTITPPITAAFLGAAYWSSCALEFLAARETSWARARIAIAPALVFTTLTLAATLLHVDKFHFGRPRVEPVFAAWAWALVYVLVPPVLAWLVVRQVRRPGGDPARAAPLGGLVRGVLGVQAGAFLLLGVALFVAPEATRGVWPWLLTPLTARAVGAWLLGLGSGAAQAIWENDWGRIWPAAVSYTIFGLGEFWALARYPGAVDWSEPRALIYLCFLWSILLVGLYGLYSARPARRPAPGAAD